MTMTIQARSNISLFAYGGSDIGAGNEINGVTFGGVGSGTTVEYIEVFHSADDGFEFFGGTVNAKMADCCISRG